MRYRRGAQCVPPFSLRKQPIVFYHHKGDSIVRKWLIGLLMILGLCAGFAQAETYVVAVDGTGDFHTLTEAAAASSTGDTILLRAGVYGERETFPIVLDHAVTIEGEDGAVLDSPRFKTMLSVTADGVTLRNIRFQVRNGASLRM